MIPLFDPSSEKKPLEVAEKTISFPIGMASPLWMMFAATAATGVAFWWATRWLTATNLEALLPEPVLENLPEPRVETPLEAAPEAIIEAVMEAAREPALEIAPLAEPVVEAVVEAAPEPVVEAIPEPVIPVIEAAPLAAPEARTVVVQATPKAKAKAAAPSRPRTISNT